jgi:hypothetical protein
MWLETDHHGMVNLDYVKRIDLAGDMEKKTFGIYLFDVDGNTYPIVDVPRFRNIGVFQGKETEQDTQAAIYTFYTVAKRLMAGAKGAEVITIEAIYREFAAEWYAQQKREMARTEQKAKPKKQKEAPEGQAPKDGDKPGAPCDNIHHFSDMKQFLDAYSKNYMLKFNKKPALRYETEGKMARDLVKLYPLEKLRSMLVWYFESDDEFITKADYDVKTFKAILERTQKVGSSEE